MSARAEAPRIYNLFPLLSGAMPRWGSHLERAAQMGFNYVFVNPFHLPGSSGSLYSIDDHYRFNPLLVGSADGAPEDQLRSVLRRAEELGLAIIMDLVVNHTAFDSHLVADHPYWYKRDERKQLVHPGATENGKWVSWGDLATIDNAASADRYALWDYWRSLLEHYAALGFQGFRCDAAYLVPPELWRFLLAATHARYPKIQFFAETLGCTPEQTKAVAETGFDFIFNSSKWWDYSAPWCLEQQRLLAPVVPSVSFPESHDTDRLAEELGGNRAATRQRYVFAALFAAGVMAPMGFEYGFRKRLHVVNTRAEEWDEQHQAPAWDDTDFIRNVNTFKANHRIWNEEGSLEMLDSGNGNVLALQKTTRDQSERAILLFSKHLRNLQGYIMPEPARRGSLVLSDGSPIGTLKPAGYQIFLEKIFTV